MFKSLGNFLYRTPWWAMAVIGFCILLLLVLFAAPTRVMRLEETGATPEEKRAIKREIDRAVGDSALNFAENIVQSLKNHASEDSRKQELEVALRDIARARKEMANARQDAAREAEQNRREAEAQASETALETAREAAETALQSAKDAREAVEESRKEVADKLKASGVDATAAMKGFDDTIKAAKEKEKEARDALAKIKDARRRGLTIDFDSDKGFKVNGQPGVAEKSGIHIDFNDDDEPKAEDAGKADDKPAGKASPTGKPIAPPVAPSITLPKLPGAPLPPVAQPQAPAKPQPPALPLAPELRDNIRSVVANDVRRVGIGSIAVLVFIPLFVMLLVAKVLVGRSRRAQEFAEQKKKEAEVSNVNRQITEARLQALQAQVEPHFLYNTLANVQALTEVDPAQANQMTGHLIQYLRSSLPKMRENTSTVGQEVELVRAYLNILKMRMGERLDFAIDCESDLLSISFPPMMLPSLVENAIKHGLEPQREGGRIDVVVTRVLAAVGSRIRVAVKDTGRGLTDTPTQAGGGVGLSNIRERLIAIYGDQGRLTLESNEPRGVIATIEVPAETGNTNGGGASGGAGFGPSTSSAGFSAGAAKAAAPSGPQNWWTRTRAAIATTHGVWAKIISFTFTTLMMIAAVLFGLALAALYAGVLPVNIAGTPLVGAEGMAVGTMALVVGFAAVALAVVVVVAVLYGLGVMAAGLLLFIPVVILIGSFPALAPFLLIGFVIYWFVKRKRAAQGNQQGA